jgi:four helix bundle protein
MRRAAVSVVSNFAEGYLKKSKKEKDMYLERSVTSLHELEVQTDISKGNRLPQTE